MRDLQTPIMSQALPAHQGHPDESIETAQDSVEVALERDSKSLKGHRRLQKYYTRIINESP
jgi:hypothetical protein